jgi:hypothetical protein
LESIIESKFLNGKTHIFIFDLFAVLTIYLIPSISHLLGFPLYYFDPMRLMLILSLVYTNRNNTLLIAGTLPLVSLLISGHPALIKTLLIGSELTLNVWLFYRLSRKIKNNFIPIFFSIIIAKVFYYSAKYISINTSLINGELFSTPLYLQILIVILFSGFVYLVQSRR